MSSKGILDNSNQRENEPAKPGSLERAYSVASVEQSKNMCSWAAAILESALYAARKGEIEWALTKSEIAVRTLKKAKSLMPLNEKTHESPAAHSRRSLH